MSKNITKGEAVMFTKEWRSIKKGNIGIVIEKLILPAPPLGIKKHLFKVYVKGAIYKVPQHCVKGIKPL